MNRLRQEAKQKKAAKHKIEVARYREAARAKDLEGFQAKQAAEGDRSKKAARAKELEGFKAKQAAEGNRS